MIARVTPRNINRVELTAFGLIVIQRKKLINALITRFIPAVFDIPCGTCAPA
jgi:hypothetical protein